MKETIKQFIEAYCGLCYSNMNVGIWDNRRFEAARRPNNGIDFRYIWVTELESRKYVEYRAKYRTQLENSFKKLIETLKER